MSDEPDWLRPAELVDRDELLRRYPKRDEESGIRPLLPTEVKTVDDDVCTCEFDPYDDPSEGDSWHFRRTCVDCGHMWWGLHCPHDGYQNACPKCGKFPVPATPGNSDASRDKGE